MNKVFSKYKRGDVWYIKFVNENGDGVIGSSVQKKSRPYVIVSCEENNNNAPVFQVIPIATMKYDHLPPHVYFKNGERDQIVLCEQITTISVLDFQREGSRFLYSFNLDFINKIDDALASQLGIKARVADMNVLENLIDKISKDKEDELKKKYETNLEMRVEQIAAKLSEKFGISLTSDDLITGRGYNNSDLKYAPNEILQKIKEKDRVTKQSPEISEEIQSTNNNNEIKITLPWDKSKTVSSTPSNTSFSSSKKVSDNKEVKGISKKRNKWTDDKMKQFLIDKETMSVQALADKYNVKKKSIYQLAFLFKDRLKEKK